MKLGELCKKISIEDVFYGGKALNKNDKEYDKVFDSAISPVVTDSRNAAQGSLFICLRGTKTDGNDYIDKAIASGASAIMTDESGTAAEMSGNYSDIIFVVTDSARRACSYIYDAVNGYPSERMKFFAVTGTNGKTSVTYMLKCIFEAAMIKCGLIGTVSCYSGDKKLTYKPANESAAMTTPDPEQLYPLLAQMADDGCRYVILEATSHALALDKLAPISFEMGIFTNLTPDHLDFHKSMENYYLAKLKLFGSCKTAIINCDDRFSERFQNDIAGKCRTVTCSAKYAFADYYSDSISNLGVGGCEYRIRSKKVIMKIKCRIPGRFTVINSLEAAAAALESKIRPSIIYDALASIAGINGRMENVSLCPGADFSVFIDYAHTPDALENLLKTVADFRINGQRIVLLFGCGGDRDKTKRPVMGKIASELADRIIITSDNSRTEDPKLIIDRIVSGIRRGCDYTVIYNRRDAIDYAVKTAHKGDIILLAGKGHEDYEIDAHGKHEFNEKEIARNAARKYFSH